MIKAENQYKLEPIEMQVFSSHMKYPHFWSGMADKHSVPLYHQVNITNF